MATPQLSPGVIVREVDLTAGRAENVLDNIGAIAGPFSIGPVDEPIIIENQQQLINTFGTPLGTDRQYEYWLTASSYLSYGGILKVVRTSGANLNNANCGVDTTTSAISILIKNKEDYELNFETASTFYFAGRNPGTWANSMKVCMIDNKSDQILGISTNNPSLLGVKVGAAVTTIQTNAQIPAAGIVSSFTGVLKGIITGVTTDTVQGNSTFEVKILERVADDTITFTTVGESTVGAAITLAGIGTTVVNVASTSGLSTGDFVTFAGAADATAEGNLFRNEVVTFDSTSITVASGVGTVLTVLNTTVGAALTAGDVSAGVTTVALTDITGVATGQYFTGAGLVRQEIVGLAGTEITLATAITAEATVGTAATVERAGVALGATALYENKRVDSGAVTPVTYQQSDLNNSFNVGETVYFNDGTDTGDATIATELDWYDQQTLDLTNPIFWKSIAPRPVSSNYSTSRGGSNDSVHIAVVDDIGAVTGVQGSLLESFTFMSKAFDAKADGDNPVRTWYKDFLRDNSKEIFAGFNPSGDPDTYWGFEPVASAFSSGFTPKTTSEGLWGQNAQDVDFSSIGNVTFTLDAGVDYQAGEGMAATLADLATSYNLFVNEDEEVDYLMMGPGLDNQSETQAKANLLISIAQQRKDCIATISPHRANVVNLSNTTTQTSNLLSYYSPIASSSYAVLDSGYKYTFDRFNNQFRYVPCNGDTAGLMFRTSVESYPWFSPAGYQRGILNNAVKLAYNPTKSQRDQLYSARINPVITQTGVGTLLFGDKTALAYASAFDRINVRRLFLTVEQALEGAANTQLFELNDANTRSNFVNIVEPYLRDVQAKRGVYDFLVVCDETNNTPDIIDNNEFRADIFLQPTKSINFITLTFVATRTGISFSEVVGTV